MTNIMVKNLKEFLLFGVGLSISLGVCLLPAMVVNRLILGEWVNLSLIIGCVFGSILTELMIRLAIEGTQVLPAEAATTKSKDETFPTEKEDPK